MQKQKGNSFLVVLIFIVVGIVFCFPKIYDFVETQGMPKIEGKKENKNTTEKKLDETIVDSLHFPIMRSSIYENNTYYSLNEFTIGNMSNSDILYNAFLDIYTGNLTDYGSYGCSSNSKQFSKDYMNLRIKNILGKDVNYNLENFYVPEGSNTNYVGEWVFDSGSGSFIYKGLCASKATSTTYYDLKEFISAEDNDGDVIVRYYVGFARVEGNNYNIYSDVQMQNEIMKGTLTSIDDLDDIFKGIDKKSKKTYKYTFKNTLCSYNEYCLYKGQWE